LVKRATSGSAWFADAVAAHVDPVADHCHPGRSCSSTANPSFSRHGRLRLDVTQRIDSFDRAPAHNQLDVFVQQFALH
jgi:hypothetical protein